MVRPNVASVVCTHVCSALIVLNDQYDLYVTVSEVVYGLYVYEFCYPLLLDLRVVSPVSRH